MCIAHMFFLFESWQQVFQVFEYSDKKDKLL